MVPNMKQLCGAYQNFQKEILTKDFLLDFTKKNKWKE